MTDTMRRIVRARTRLLLEQPFFGVLALQAHVVESTVNDTAWTDGRTIGFNPEYVATLSDGELCGVFAHEVMHNACGHPWRRDGRDAKRWNKACDYAINPIIVEAAALPHSIMALPKDVLIDAQFTGKSAEWIYDRLPEGNESDDPSQGNGGTGEVLDAPSDSQSGDMTEADWQQATKLAERMATAQGKLPGSMARAIQEASRSRVDWRSVLRRFISEVTKSDYSWQRPNTRYIASGLYLPALYSHECGKLVVAVDTSGSIDDVLLAQFSAEVDSIASEVQPSSVHVVYCDAQVNAAETFERGERVTLTPHGGGGTDFSPVFEHVSESDDQPVALVYLTDLYGTFPSDAPDYPVLWASVSGEQSVPFGEVVAVE